MEYITFCHKNPHMYIHTYTHTYKYTHIHRYIHIYMHTHIHPSIYRLHRQLLSSINKVQSVRLDYVSPGQSLTTKLSLGVSCASPFLISLWLGISLSRMTEMLPSFVFPFDIWLLPALLPLN